MSGLPPVHGHEAARAALGQAALRGDVPGSILIHGPTGIGKQRLGLWIAQRILCLAPEQIEPCGNCQPCRLNLRLEHPDTHWFFPLPRPKGASGPEKLADALEEARAAELAARRADPCRPTAPGEPAGLFLAHIRTIRRLASTRPAMGARNIFLIGDTEALVPQESSPEAANALLKLLEEPPAATTFILTASDPDALLPTLRSRLRPVRLRPLPLEAVVRFLVAHRDVDAAGAHTAARLAEGSIGRALAFLPTADAPAPLETLRQQARTLLAAATGSELARLTAAHATPPAGARGDFSDTLESLTLWLRDLAATATGAAGLVVNADAREMLDDLAHHLPDAAAAIPDAIRIVEQARTLAHGNVNPQLILACMLRDLHATLTRQR